MHRWKLTQLFNYYLRNKVIFELLSCDDECSRITPALVSGDQYDTTRTVSLGASDARVE